jgi:hypothetical protein
MSHGIPCLNGISCPMHCHTHCHAHTRTHARTHMHRIPPSTPLHAHTLAVIDPHQRHAGLSACVVLHCGKPGVCVCVRGAHSGPSQRGRRARRHRSSHAARRRNRRSNSSGTHRLRGFRPDQSPTAGRIRPSHTCTARPADPMTLARDVLRHRPESTGGRGRMYDCQ